MENITTTQAPFLHVEAHVRYWEDATVNGVEDEDGDIIPCKEGSLWKPVIDLRTGVIQGWPSDVEAVIHYKICDQGQYWLADDQGQRLYKWGGDYVPDDLLCVGDRGYGDYIIFTVEKGGQIKGWQPPSSIKNDEDDRWLIV